MGSESISHTDFSLPGPFPIEWTRTYCSSLDAYDEGAIGARWITPFTTRFDCVDDGLQFHDADWWSVDKTGHGESAWKVYDESGAWLADTDIYGDRMSKHKSGIGKNVNFRSLKCKDEK
jgi:hypothetical protein